MKIIVETATNIVKYAARNLELTPTGVRFRGGRDRSLTTANAVLHKIAPPRDFTGNGYTYENGTFTLTPTGQAQLDAIAAKEAEAQAESDAKQAIVDARAAIKADATFGTITAAQVKTYIRNNVTDLASAKVLLEKMGGFLIYMRDRG